ncbi:MAG: PPOX class F420-dependent oxidoreductase [Thermoanaerobaculia bacterium]|nr:PPOX class F420-dependent oxidoreductase [Thermoanaerobaculia bacterium]
MDPLAGERYISLATFRKSGKEVATPVWFAERDGRYYVFSEASAGKVKRLRNSARARVAACDIRGRVHGDWHNAEAVLLEDPDAIAEAHRTIRSKYAIQMRIADFLATLSGRIRRRAWIEIALA